MHTSRSFYLILNSFLLILFYHLILLTHNILTEYSHLAEDNKSLKEKLVWDKELKNKLSEMKIQWDGVGGYIEAAKDDIDSGNFAKLDEKIDSLPKEYLETIYTERILKHGLKLYGWIYTDFIYPVQYPEKSYISSEYFNLRKYNGVLVYHQALDIVTTTDHRIIASADGIVKEVGYNSILGNFINLRHVINNEYFLTEYAHAAMIYVKTGQKVKKGDVIGIIGLSGNTSGFHLHFAIKKWEPSIYNYYPINMVATSTWGLKIK